MNCIKIWILTERGVLVLKLIKTIALLLFSVAIGMLVATSGVIAIMRLFNISNNVIAIVIGVIFGNLGAEIGIGLHKKIS